MSKEWVTADVVVSEIYAAFGTDVRKYDSATDSWVPAVVAEDKGES